MARKRKSKYQPDFNACYGRNNHENFGTVYESMVKSEMFQRLSAPAKLLYILCRVQHRSGEGKACLYKHSEEEGVIYPENCFVFPAKQQKEYGLTRTNSSRYFKELIEAGFLENYENNKFRRKVNVYCFSSKWKDSS